MPRTYNDDLRKRVLDFLAKGGKPLEAARRFNLHKTTIYAWRKQAEAGRRKALRRGRKRRNSKVKAVALRDFVFAHPYKSLAEIGEHFGVSGVTIGRRLRQLKYTSQGAPPPSRGIVMPRGRVARLDCRGGEPPAQRNVADHGEDL